MCVFIGFHSETLKGQDILKAGENGSIVVPLGETINQRFAIGVTPTYKGDRSFENTAFCFVVFDTQLKIYEYGKYVMSAGSLSNGDSIKIERNGDKLFYYKNEIKVRTVFANKEYELMLIKIGEGIPEIKTGFQEKLDVTALIVNITPNDTGAVGIIDLNVIGGEPPYSYEWKTGQKTKYINNLEQGEYSVVISDAKGQQIKKVYSIDYIVAAKVPSSFVIDSGLIIKHPDSNNDYEAMVSENKFENGSVVKAAFKGEREISFVFGIDSRKDLYEEAKSMEYAVLCKQNELFFISQGKILATLGKYNSGEDVKFTNKNNTLTISKGEKDLYRTEIKDKTYYSKISLERFFGGLYFWITENPWYPTGENDYYASLSKKLDGGFYPMKNYIKFKYKEKYNDHTLSYKVYDWKRNVKMQNVGVSNHRYGINYHRIAAYNYLDSEVDGYYTLEVTNAKNEVYKMRFHFEKAGKNGLIFVWTVIDISDFIKKCCFDFTCICKPLIKIVSPCNPCVFKPNTKYE